MRNAGLEEAQAGIKIAGRIVSNLRYADDTTLWQKVKRNSKASWWKWKRRSEKAGLKLNIQKTKIVASGHRAITSWQIRSDQSLSHIRLFVTPWIAARQTTWSASWEICMQVRKQQLELDMEQQTGSK